MSGDPRSPLVAGEVVALGAPFRAYVRLMRRSARPIFRYSPL
jgi:hypothetical protein